MADKISITICGDGGCGTFAASQWIGRGVPFFRLKNVVYFLVAASLRLPHASVSAGVWDSWNVRDVQADWYLRCVAGKSSITLRLVRSQWTHEYVTYTLLERIGADVVRYDPTIGTRTTAITLRP